MPQASVIRHISLCVWLCPSTPNSTGTSMPCPGMSSPHNSSPKLQGCPQVVKRNYSFHTDCFYFSRGFSLFQCFHGEVDMPNNWLLLYPSLLHGNGLLFFASLCLSKCNYYCFYCSSIHCLGRIWDAFAVLYAKC